MFRLPKFEYRLEEIPFIDSEQYTHELDALGALGWELTSTEMIEGPDSEVVEQSVLATFKRVLIDEVACAN